MAQREPGRMLRAAPPRDAWSASRMGRFLEAVESRHGVSFATYEDAWAWSVAHPDEFWREVWREFDVRSDPSPGAVLGSRTMPGAKWFPGVRLSYADHVYRALRARGDAPALIARSQTAGDDTWSAARLLDEVARLQTGMRRLGVGRGDRVVGYLPNIPQAVALYLAAAGLGAVFSSVPPEMGVQSAVDRIAQLDPALLVAVDGYVWGDRRIDRSAELARIRAALPGTATVLLPSLEPEARVPIDVIPYAAFADTPGPLDAEPVPFEHPLVVLFSSGTTGRPKAIVHGHGGLLLEHLKMIGLHFGIDERDTTLWYSTTGWMVWTLSVSTLLLGASMVLLDGDPGWPTLDGAWSQWAVAAETGATYLVTGSAYLAACAHAGLTPGSTWDLGRLREIQCSGSPLAADVAEWVYREVGPELLLAPTSGGTDICSAFLGGSPLTPVWAGEMSCRPLGAAVDSWGPHREPLVGEPGELVCTAPIPSMPVGFWGDADGSRYHESYFEHFPGVWRHGDWLVRTERDSWIITGRSDATLNRGGVRLGTAEFYAVLDAVPGVADSMVLHFEDDGGMGRLVLLAVAEGGVDRVEAEARIRSAIRSELSPRHVPDDVVFVPSVPRTSSGKRLEIPLKRLVAGTGAGPGSADPGDLAATRPDDVPGIVAAIRARLERPSA